VLLEPLLDDADELGRDAFAFEILYGLDRGVVRDGQHPAHRAKACLGIKEFADFMDFDAGFHDPVVAGQARVKDAVGHVARHFLRAHQHDLQLFVVAPWEVGAFGRMDADPRALENFNRRFLQTPLRKTKLQLFQFVHFLKRFFRICLAHFTTCSAKRMADGTSDSDIPGLLG